MARKNKFIARSRKISAAAFVKALVFNGEGHSQLSLLDLKCDLFEQAGCHVSQEAIHKRFTPEAVSFLKEVFSQQLKWHLSANPAGGGFFSSICIKDSTKFKLPDAYIGSYPSYRSFNKASSLMNIQYEYDLLSGRWLCLGLTKATRNDQSDSKETVGNIKGGSLNIRDLGYVTTNYLKGVENNNAYYLNRLPKIGVYQKAVGGGYVALDWAALDKKMRGGRFEYLELDVYLGARHKIKSRMVLSPVPQEVASGRVRKAALAGKRSKGYQVSKEYKVKARYNIFITNVPGEVLPAEEVIEAYKLRWQIELVFKAWKSNLGVHKVKAVKKERMECQLIAKFIWILLNSKLLSIANHALKEGCPGMGCSPMKFFKRAKIFSQAFRGALINLGSFLDWFNGAIIPLAPSLAVEKRGSKEPHCQVLYKLFEGLS